MYEFICCAISLSSRSKNCPNISIDPGTYTSTFRCESRYPIGRQLGITSRPNFTTRFARSTCMYVRRRDVNLILILRSASAREARARPNGAHIYVQMRAYTDADMSHIHASKARASTLHACACILGTCTPFIRDAELALLQ